MIGKSRDFCERLKLRHPIIQGPMAGGGSTPALVAAVSNEGGLGSLGAAYMTPEQITQAISDIRRLTDKPFNVNLFAGGAEDRPFDAAPMLDILARHHKALGLPPPETPRAVPDPIPAQMAAVIAGKVPVFSFTFGIPGAKDIAQLKKDGVYIIGTATTVGEARLLAKVGVDAIVAQGSESGAHRGTFAAPFDAAMIGTMALVPQVVDACPDLPVLAAGGIMDGRGIVAALALGAAAAVMGTAFLATDEAGVPDAHKDMLKKAAAEDTKTTRAFSGRPARGIVNGFMRDAERDGGRDILPFPVQNALTRPMRNAAGKAGNTDDMSLWAGQGLGLARRMPAAQLMRVLVREYEAAKEKLTC